MDNSTSPEPSATDKPMVCGNATQCPFRNGKGCTGINKLKAALVYAQLGFAVYPSSANSMAHAYGLGKYKPDSGKGGFHLATTSVDRVKEWAEYWQRADTNVAVRTGSASRLLVIDCDRSAHRVAPGAAAGAVTFGDQFRTHLGIDEFTKWEAEHGLIAPRDAVSTTPSESGTHIWLRLPETWDREIVREVGWLDDVDLLWDRHSIKAPPSERVAQGNKVAGSYKFTSGCPCQVPEAPAELLDAILATPSAKRTQRWQVQHGTTGSRAKKLLISNKAEPINLATLKTTGVPVGEQNQTYQSIATSMARRGVPMEEAAALCMEIASVSPEGDPNDPYTMYHFMNDGHDGGRRGIVLRAYEFVAEDASAETRAAKEALSYIFKQNGFAQ